MTSDLIRLQIPKIMREVVYEHNPELHSLIASGATDKISVSQLYWAEHVCGGRPRELFRSQLGIARTTANYHLRRFETLGLVPKTKERSTRR
jgi:predicted transcriptional regulator